MTTESDRHIVLLALASSLSAGDLESATQLLTQYPVLLQQHIRGKTSFLTHCLVLCPRLVDPRLLSPILQFVLDYYDISDSPVEVLDAEKASAYLSEQNLKSADEAADAVNEISQNSNAEALSLGWTALLDIPAEEFISSWIKARCHKVPLDFVQETVESAPKCVADSLADWLNGIVIPLKSVNSLVPLDTFEQFTADEALQFFSLDDIRHSDVKIVSSVLQKYLPYISYTGHWNEFWLWLTKFAVSQSDDPCTADTLKTVLGECLKYVGDAKLYEQLASVFLASVLFTSGFSSLRAVNSLQNILFQLEKLPLQENTPFSQESQLESIQSLLEPLKCPKEVSTDSIKTLLESPLTYPAKSTVQLFKSIQETISLLLQLVPSSRNPGTFTDVSSTSIFNLLQLRVCSTPQQQKQFLYYYLLGSLLPLSATLADVDRIQVQRNEQEWSTFITSIRWIRDNSHIFYKLEKQAVEEDILTCLLKTYNFNLVKFMYLSNDEGLTDLPKLHKIILRALWDNVNKASNGSRSRGYMKSANECLVLLKVMSKENVMEDVSKAESFIQACDELAAYSLSFVPGMPATPCDILHHAERNIAKVFQALLEQNRTAYLELDQVHRIALLLEKSVSGNSLEHPVNRSVAVAFTDQLTAMCIETALANDDFDTAYKYAMEDPDLLNRNSETVSELWTAFYQISKFVSVHWDDPDSCPMEVLERKLQVLSRVLTKCHDRYFPPLLKQWGLLNDAYTLRLELENAETEGAADSDRGFPRIRTAKTSARAAGVPVERLESRLSRALQSSAATLLNSEDSGVSASRDQLSNLLVSGLGWAIGADIRNIDEARLR